MKGYYVTYTCIYSDYVLANSPEEAADIVANECPCDVDGLAYVIDWETKETFEC